LIIATCMVASVLSYRLDIIEPSVKPLILSEQIISHN